MDRTAQRALAERFLALPLDKQRVFHGRLLHEGIELSSLPIPQLTTLGHEGPLSHAQERLWFLWKLDQDSAAYNIATALRIDGPLSVSCVRTSLQALVARHPSLRTRFIDSGDSVRQCVEPQSALPLECFDLREQAGTERRARELAHTIATRPFDLESGPLLRMALLALAPERHVLVLVVHHIVADGWSLNVLMREFAQSYVTLVQGKAPTYSELPVSYLDYARFQRAILAAGESERRLALLRPLLGDEPLTLELPLDHPRPSELSGRGGVVTLELAPTLVAQLASFARARSSTLFATILASFGLLLHRYSGQRELLVGVPVANRERPELQGLVGLFVNTLVVRSELRPQLSFDGYFVQVEASLRAAQAQQELPFEQLVDALAPSRSLDRNPVFQALYNHQTRASGAWRGLSDLTVTELAWGEGAAQCDLSLDTEEDDAGVVRGRITYARELFDHATVERLAGHFIELLWAVSQAPERKLGELAPIPRAQQRALAKAWESVELAPAFTPVHAQIRERALAEPEQIALLSDDAACSYSYAELEAHSDLLAQHLRSHGVGADVLVAVCMTRGPAMIVAMLAVLRAGGAFVPVDPDYPPQRASEMLQAAAPHLVLTERTLSSRFAPSSTCAVLTCEELLARAPSSTSDREHVKVHPEQLAYVIFTSGSTGKPKGVAMSHGSLAMHCRAIAKRYRMTPADRALHFASIGFDASIEQWIVPLLSGARLIVRGPELWSSEQAATLIREHEVSWFEMPPLYLTEVAAHCVARGERLALRACSVGGEAVSRESFAVIKRAIGDAALVNGYGPTETAITPLTWTAEAGDSFASAYAPIGSVVGARTAYVLDADLNFVPAGATGELYLGLGGLARCYYGQPAETAQRFLPDPFVGGRMYRTGDLVRQRADAQLEYVGRADHQLKIRGFRVELGEIEARLLAQPEVREAVVVAHERDATKQLVAYVATGEAESLARVLSERLGAELPAYMVPSQILCLSALPRSASGKIDRKALPAPSFVSRSFVSPEGERERVMAELWSALLGVAEVGAVDNFFELGGDSILSLQLVSRAQRVGLTITPRDVFQHQTLRALAQVARSEQRAAQEEALPAEPFALTPIQCDFFAQPVQRRHHYNQALLLEVRAALEPARLERALAQVLTRHDALRLRFIERADGQVVQRYEPSTTHSPSELWVRDCRDQAELEQLCEQAQRSLNLSTGPLLRALYARLPGQDARLLLVVHHLVIDGVSWRVLLEDLSEAYAQSSPASEAALPAKTASYARWSRALTELAVSDALLSELPYWTAQHDGPSELLATRDGLPAHAQRANLAQTGSETLKLSKVTTQALLRRAPAAYRTHVHELLLTALAHALCSESGATSAFVELEGHGREDVGVELDVSRTVGWFTSLFPVRLPVHAELGASIAALKEALRNVPRRGLGHGVLAALGPANVRSELARLPKPSVTFNYLGQFSEPDAQALFTPAPGSVGALRDAETPLANALEINAQVYAGELTLTFNYRSAVYDARTIRALTAKLAQTLEAVVEHCTAPGVGMLTPSDVPLAALSQAALERLGTRYGRVVDVYPLTPLQQGMLFHSLLAPAAQTYVSQLDLTVTDLDLPRFVLAFEAALARHPILRTGFVVDASDQPLQVVLERAQLPVEVRDLSERAPTARELLAICAAEHKRPLALDAVPLMRLLVLRLDARRHHLIWTHHHLLLDGWSSSRLLGEVLQAYAGSEVATPRSGFREYLQHCAALPKAESAALFERMLSDLEQTALLADGRFVESEELAPHEVALSPATTARLKQFARSARVTLNTVVQAAYGLMLQRYTGRQAASFGATVAGRPPELADSDAWLGMFINTLPVLVRARANQTVGDFLRDVQSTMAELRDHEHVSLSDIQRWVGTPGRALFDALLVFENYPVAEALAKHSGALQFSEVRHRERTEYPLTLSVALGETLRCQFARSGALGAAWVARFARDFEQLLHAFLEGAQRPIADLSRISSEERRELAEFGRSHVVGRPLLPVHLAVAAHAAREPRREALVCDGVRLTYEELARRMTQVAGALMAQGIGREQVVGVCMERSAEAFVALLGVAASGAAFAPLDPAYPSERLHAIAERAGLAAVVVSDARTRAAFPSRRCITLAELEQQPHARRPLAQVVPEQLAYVIHTSGSTGTPKGVAVSHGAIARHCAALIESYALSEQDVSLTFAPFIFDASIEQWMAPWLLGARVVARGPTVWTPAETQRAIIAEGVSWVHLTPSYCAELVHWLEQRDEQLHVRVCSIGGEALSRESLRALGARAPRTRLFNAYGPTEAVVTPLVWQAPEGGACDTAYAPLGRPIAQRAARVLDKNLEPVPRGVVGELYLTGETLARGYHAQAALTAERFLPDEEGGRLYRTGDLARYLEDGTLDFLGRADAQVKLRGFRIELGDIENALLAEANVAEATVLLVEGDGGPRLVGFVAAEGALEGEELRRALTRKLPQYMVPAQVLVLAELPRAATGKVDRKALSALERPRRAYRAPESELEQRLAKLVQELLGSREPVGRDDDFFERGGDSLLAMRLASRIKEELSVELPVRTIFEAPVLGQLAEYVEQARSGDDAERDILAAIQEVEDLSEQGLEALLREAEAAT